MPAWTSVSRNGSTAVEFSGQTTKSGSGSPPRRPRRPGLGEPHVVGRHLAVDGRHVEARAGHVALHGRDRGRAAALEWERHERGREGHHGQPGHDGVRRPGGRAHLQHDPRERRAGQRDEEADADHADPRQGVGPRGAGGRVDQPAERHPAEGEPAAQRLDPDPPQRGEDRPRAHPHAPRDPDAEGHEEGRLHGAHRDPGVRADRAHPDHHGVDETHPEDQAREPRPPRLQAAHAQDEHRDRGGHQPRVADRLERRRQHEPAGEGEEAAEQHAQTVADGPMGRIERLQRCGRNRGASDQHALVWLTSARSCLRPCGPSRIQPPRGAVDRSTGGGHRWLRVPHARLRSAEGATRELHRRTPEPSRPREEVSTRP